MQKVGTEWAEISNDRLTKKVDCTGFEGCNQVE